MTSKPNATVLLTRIDKPNWAMEQWLQELKGQRKFKYCGARKTASEIVSKNLKYNEGFFCGYTAGRIKPGDRFNTLTTNKKTHSQWANAEEVKLEYGIEQGAINDSNKVNFLLVAVDHNEFCSILPFN